MIDRTHHVSGGLPSPKKVIDPTTVNAQARV
jgi:hypothetical protein